MNDKLFINLLESNELQIQKVIRCNKYTEKFGVRLSEKDALMLLEARRNSLKEQERIEFGEGIIEKLIFAFCDSSYIYQDNYSDSIEYLMYIFYLYKNESLDEISDDELMEYMKKSFEGECQGSLEYLEHTCLEKFARNIRNGKSLEFDEEEKDD